MDSLYIGRCKDTLNVKEAVDRLKYWNEKARENAVAGPALDQALSASHLLIMLLESHYSENKDL